MSDIPETRYAHTSDGVHIAYQVWGDGPLDLVMIPGFISHQDFQWEWSSYAALLRRLGSFARVISFDKRGTGLSDRTDELPDVDRRMLDLMAVMDATDAERPALFGVSEGGPMAILFAATHPDRTAALVLFGSYANPVVGPDHPIGVTPEQLQELADHMEPRWGEGVALGSWAPSLADDPRARELWARLQRLSASPGAFSQLVTSYNLIDVRPALDLVQAPTLILHRTGDRMIPVELARELVAGIEGARLVEFEGDDHLLATTNWPEILDVLAEFLTGERHALQPERVLATVLFTDIVDSTQRVAELGDEQWRGVLDAHDRLAERQVARFGGRVVKSTGDGLLAVFDGPTRAIRAANAVIDGAPGLGIDVRAGLHTGEIVERGDDVAGLAVHVAARVADRATAGQVLASRTTVDLVSGSGLDFEPAGEWELRGLDGTWSVFAVEH